MKAIDLFGKTYHIKPTLKAYALFEQMSGYSIFEINQATESLNMNLQFIYAMVKANYPEFMDYSKFLESWDDVPNSFGELGLVVADLMLEVEKMVTTSSSLVEEKMKSEESKKK